MKSIREKEQELFTKTWKLKEASFEATKNGGKYELSKKLQEIETRDFTDKLSTPTVVIVRGGEFVDAKAGAQALNGGMEYLSFVKFVEGEYIGKVE